MEMRTARKLADIETKDLKAEVVRRELIDLARYHPQIFINKVQIVKGSGLNSKDADEICRLARDGKPEEAVGKISRARFRQIKPSTA